MMQDRNKSILFLHAYYDPEITADTHLDEDLIQCLLQAGYTITVLCPTPTRGISRETVQEYRNRKRESFYDGRLNVVRFSAPREGTNPLGRALRYFYCSIRQYHLAIKMDAIDLIYCISTPPTQGMLSALVKKRMAKRYKKRVESIYYLEDIFPDTLAAAGLSKKDSLLWKIGRKIEDYTYRHASKIVTVSDSCVRNILEKGVDPGKVVVVNNWIDLSDVKYVPRAENTLFSEFCLDREKFYVVYAGNLGKAQNVDLMLDAAKAFAGTPEIAFVIFGSGGEEKRLQGRIQDEGIGNVHLLPLQPVSRVSQVYSLGDADVVTCKKGFGASALPSKTWNIMATERPVIASFDLDGDLCKLLHDTQSGLCAEADSVDAFAEAVDKLYRMDAAQRREMGKNGRMYAMRHRDRAACTGAMAAVFHELTE